MRRVGVVLLVFVLLAACSSSASDSPRAQRRSNNSRIEKKDDKKDGPGPSLSPDPAPTTTLIAESRPWWKLEIDKILRKKPMSIQVRFHEDVIYSSNAQNRRVPASTEKLVLSMALFDRFGPDATFPTTLSARRKRKGEVRGDLWVTGSGNPALAGNPIVLDQLPPGSTDIDQLVRALKSSGIETIDGNIMAATDPFARDWFAPGWKPFFPSSEVGLPTALTFNGNIYKQHYTKRPELKLAESFRRRLRRAGIEVSGIAGAGHAPRKLRTIASVPSPRLAVLARFMNRQSANFFAEVLGKKLGARSFGEPGTIAKGARAIARYAEDEGVEIEAHDSSGLSYANQMSARDLAFLIESSEDNPWANVLRSTLATGGEGTLKERLHGVRVRAKTGTLDEVSALAGWVWLNKTGDWAEFAILSRGIDKSSAVQVEDKIVRLLHRSAS